MTDETVIKESNLSEQLKQRRHKLAELRSEGFQFPNDAKRSTLAQELHDQYGEVTTEKLTENTVSVTLAGRIMTQRVMGKASFFHLQDV